MTTLFYILFLLAQANDDDDCAFDLTRREPTGLTNRLEGLFESSKPSEPTKLINLLEGLLETEPPQTQPPALPTSIPKIASDPTKKFSVSCETRREFYKVGENSPFRTKFLETVKRDFKISVWNGELTIFYFGMHNPNSKGMAVINGDGTFKINGLPLFSCEGKISENNFEATLIQTEFEPPINGVVSKDTITCRGKI